MRLLGTLGHWRSPQGSGGQICRLNSPGDLTRRILGLDEHKANSDPPVECQIRTGGPRLNHTTLIGPPIFATVSHRRLGGHFAAAPKFFALVQLAALRGTFPPYAVIRIGL